TTEEATIRLFTRCALRSSSTFEWCARRDGPAKTFSLSPFPTRGERSVVRAPRKVKGDPKVRRTRLKDERALRNLARSYMIHRASSHGRSATDRGCPRAL